MHTEHEIQIKAAEIIASLTEALNDLGNPVVRHRAALYALDHPHIQWEPISIAAAVSLFARLEREKAKAAASADPALATPPTSLPAEPVSTDDSYRKVALPNEPYIG
jgi:hypothetical protein